MIEEKAPKEEKDLQIEEKEKEKKEDE